MNKHALRKTLAMLLTIALMVGMLVVPAAAADKTEVDVWDFGAEWLADTAEYKFNNHVTAAMANSWTPDGSVEGEKQGHFRAEGFSVDGLSFTTGKEGDLKANHHRLYSTNPEITNVAAAEGMTGDGKDPYCPDMTTEKAYWGYIYSNSAATPEVCISVECLSGDVITVIVSRNNGDSQINFEGPNGVEGSDIYTGDSRKAGQTMTFYAAETGTYKIYSVNEKLTMARLYRQHASEVTVSGKIAEAAGMPAGYSVVYTNTITGAEIVIPVSGGRYSGTILAPYSYEVSLKDATGFAVLEGNELEVTAADTAVTNNLIIQSVDRVAVSGTITGLDANALAKMGQDLLFTPVGDGIVYVPEVTVNSDGTYTVMVEKDMPTDISALHINDYEITTAGVTGAVFTENTTLDLTFAAKPTYKVTIAPEGVELADLADAKFIFTNLHEAGETEDQVAVPYNPKSDTNLTGSVYNYVYTFTGTDNIALRDGTYDVAVKTEAGKQNVTSNVVVKGGAVTKTVPFTPASTATPTHWVFSANEGFTAEAVAAGKFNKLLLEGTVKNENGKTHAQMGAGGKLRVPVDGPCKVNVTVYYAAAGTIGVGDDTVELKTDVSTGSTSKYDTITYEYTGEAGYVDVIATATSYVTEITVEAVEAASGIEAKEHPFTSAAKPDGSGNYAQGDIYQSGVPGLKVAGTAKWWDTDHGVNFYTGSTITVTMAQPGTITLQGCQCDGDKTTAALEVTAGTVEVSADTDPVFTITDVPAGEYVITFKKDNMYIHSLTVAYPTYEVPEKKWDFNKGLGADKKTIQGAVEDWMGLKIDATTGKFYYRGSEDNWAQFNTGAKIIVPIYGGTPVGTELTVKVQPYSAGDVTVAGQASTAQQAYEDFTVTVDASHTVVVEAAKNGYIGGIEVVYPDGILPEPPQDIVLEVGADKEFKTINAALAAAADVKRDPGQRITIAIDPGDYEEQLYIKVKDVTFKNAKADQATLELKNKGVDIGSNEVRITWYYGHGYTYYSMTKGHRYDADVLAVNKANGYASYINAGSGSTDDSYWNASVLIAADGFQAEGIIFENSFNQYVSAASVQDVIEPQNGAKEGNVPRATMKTVGDTKVQEKAYVERAGAVSIKSGTKIFFDHCAFIGRQDVLYGPEGSKVALYDCDVYGGTDYIYGGMTLVAAKCDLLLNTSEDDVDVAYITAPQQSKERGYLFWNCTIDSTTPGVNTASEFRSKPGYFGRPWTANTGEALFYATNIKATDPIYVGATVSKEPVAATSSLILPVGWNPGLGGQSAKSAELETTEAYTGVDNTASRAGWATVPTQAPTVADFLGDWDPFTENSKNITIVKQTQEAAPAAPKLVTKVEIDQKSQDMTMDQTLALTATVTPDDADDKSVIWTSSDVSVLTVDENGVVTPVAGGSAMVRAASKNRLCKSEIKITVVIPASGVTLNKTSINMMAGRKTTLVATVAPENTTDKTVTFESADPTIATVDQNGKVKGVAAGETTITVTTANGKTATCAVTITPAPEMPTVAPDSISIDGADTVYVVAGDTKALTVTVTPADADDTVYWTSADTRVVTVDRNTGVIKGVKAGGPVVVTAETPDGALSDSVNVWVTPKKSTGGNVASSTGTGDKSSTKTLTNANGDKVQVVTTAAGGKTFTVTDKDGVVLAKVVIPAKAPDLAYKFEDVPEGHWAEEAINAMAAMNVVKGVSTERHIYDMNADVTRGALAQILFNLSQGTTGMANPFEDAANGWYSDAVAWAAKTGVVTGYSETTFGPEDSITREQLAVMLYRFAKLLAVDTTTKTSAPLESFVDADQVHDWATEAMSWAVEKGLLKGKGNADLDPAASASRAETAVVMDRFLDLL